MSTYCVTFRIASKTVNGKTYDDRYEKLIDNLHTGSNGFWAEPTSFILVGSSLDTNSFAKKIVEGLSRSDDMLFVFDPEDMSACYFGAVDGPDILKSFFPRAQEI
ncbi:hypothetical protein [Thalassospira profundimaris]|uniref:Uncharacterized protein n=1 Tax=Thalassospira profundimaris TaxID=502049 RepID=A0A367X5E3_9PROT|nr:hypothetical protein [Thalassospira profundimaris]RCK48888.1 hypothetical protein TH30_00690 [Thalassospira profundimaris]